MRVQFTAIRAKNPLARSAGISVALDAFTKSHAEHIVEVVRQYPSFQPIRYVRTMRLYNSWRVKKTAGYAGIQYTITNGVQSRSYPFTYYAGLVQGSNQLAMHQAHGWKKLQDYLDRPQFVIGAQAIISKGLS